MGVEDTSKLRIVIPSVTDRALIKMSNMTDSKLHHILSSAIARQASKDVYNLEIKLKDMIRGIVFICLRNCYVGGVKARENDSTYYGEFAVTYGSNHRRH
eukprot:GHVP01019232.1.p1 GENE.GHVP01019232.1~~GHVP01019232.1.p1  ORF type:complete len:100 (-),score=4.39 GHVP01019232.1:265-564(-)